MGDLGRCAAENLAIGSARGLAGLRGDGGVRSRLDSTRRQVEPYRQAWTADNRRVLAGSLPLWVVLGDSAAQGVGATTHRRGWVGQVHDRLPDPGSVAVLNLAVSGARVRDVLDAQLPQLYRLGHRVRLVTCAIGGNDMYRSTSAGIRARFTALLRGLPGPDQLSPGQRTVVTTLPQGLGRRRAAIANGVVRTLGPQRGIVVADLWATTGPPWQGKFARDMFHPNDVGYADWADAIAPAVARAMGMPTGSAQ